MSELLIAGVDEAGRGPLAGPVVAAAVILDSARPIEGLADSKRLSATKREILALKIKQQAHAWALGSANVEEIDRLNILQASMLAMCRAVTALKIAPGLIKVDGNCCPAFDCPAQAIIGGDATVAEISAASILAKTARDAEMQNLHMHYPLYAFDRHKGYPTALHRRLLQQYGACPQHRRSYAPVQAVMAQLLHV